MGNRRYVDVFLAVFLAIGLVAVILAAPAVSSARGSSAAGPDGLPGLEAWYEQALVDVSMVGADQSHLLVLPKTTTALPGWQQANSNGFGDQLAVEVSALEEFNGYLYAGTYNPTNDARIFRSPDGATWTPVTEPGFGNSHDIAPPAILDMAVFQNRLYATTGRGNASQLWRTLNGLIWAPMDVTGFSDPDNTDITALAEYDGKIYAGVTNQVTGAQIWSSFTGDNNSWTKVGPAEPATIAASVTAFAVFDGGLHAAIEFESDLPAQIWRSYGGDWETIVSNGFGDSNTMMTGGMAEFGGFLYVGAGNTANGAQLWRTNDGATWQQIITPAFGDANNQSIDMVSVFQNHLYVSTKNTVTGMEIWRSADGASWEQVNQDGFGDSGNSNSNWSSASTAFLGQLYVGTANAVGGGELWRMIPPFDVKLSRDNAQAGTAGQNVIYTLWITNTGNISDTYDLTLSGHNWTTLLSTPHVSLAPAASVAFTVTVAIPPGALGNTTDAVTVTAASQSEPATSDMAILTSTALPHYGLGLSPNQSAGGTAGQNVIYTLWITNTGNMNDTYDLTLSGQSWSTLLSTSQVSLAPAASVAFTVTVAIPAGTPSSVTDAVTVTATSHGNGSATDLAILTTKCAGSIHKIYLPLLLRAP